MGIERYSQDVEEDRLFRLVAAHYNEAQETITTAIKNTFADREEELPMLEIGCGTGLTSEIILRAHPRIHLTAIDNEERIVEAAKNRFEEREKARLAIVFADALEFLRQQPDESYSAVVSAMVLHNLLREDRKMIYIEIYRVLKKGGLFVNVDKYAQDNESEHQESLAWQLDQFNLFDQIGRPDQHKKWEKHYLEDEKPEVILYEGDFIRELTKLGFSDIKRIYRFQMEASYTARK